MAASRREKSTLLEEYAFSFVPSSALTSVVISELSHLVQEYGAEVLEPDRKGQIRLNKVTHIISNTIDFEQWKDAQLKMIPVVTTSWITSTIAKGKIAQLRPYSPDPRMIFSNVVVSCANIPSADVESINGAVMALGGMESKDLMRNVTHLCALSMDNEKCQTAAGKLPNCKIVLPHWFDDCFKLGKRIDEGPYLLPNPKILLEAPEDDLHIPFPSSQHIEGATSATPSAAHSKLTEGRTKADVFNQKKVMLAQDLNLSVKLRGIITNIILGGDGEVVESVDACDMFVCHFRDGPEYVRASQMGKTVGNLSWLYQLIINNEWTRPTHRLLHYPIPKKPLPGFEGLRITVSNYGGEARMYLENLITASGATFTKTLTVDNTHIITARNSGPKVKAAGEWNTAVVNHLWIEESYAKCGLQALTNQKYLTFPPRTNLGEVIGQTWHDETVLRQLYYPGGEELIGNTKKMRKADGGLDAAKDSSPAIAESFRRGARSAQVGDFTTPAKKRSKETDMPSGTSTGSRSAKADALNKLHGLAPDIALYEKEKKRATKDGVWGGKRAADHLDKERSAKSSSPATSGQDEEEDDVPTPKTISNKRAAKRQKLSVEMRVVLTSYPRWTQNLATEDSDRKKLRAMGILTVQDNQPCDYLAAPNLVRTRKFLRVLARGPDVINSKFIDDCLEAGKLLDPKDYVLEDKENEQKFGVKLSLAIKRARANRGRLLRNVAVYCSAEIKNGVESYQTIAEANGAIFKVYRARSGTTIKPTTEEEDGGVPPEPVYLITSNKPTERALWPKFEKMAKDGHMEPRVVAPDWLLDVAMKQELTFEPKFLVENFYGPSSQQPKS